MSTAEQVINITEDYLGPPAKRFIERISQFNLHKSLDQLTANDIPRLAEWIKVSLGMLTNDRAVIDECISRLLKLRS